MGLPPMTPKDLGKVIKLIYDIDNIFTHHRKSKKQVLMQRLIAFLYDWCDEEKKQLNRSN